MASFTFCVFVLVMTLLSLVVLLRNSKKKRSKSKLPPGTMGWPLVGEIFSYNRYRRVGSVGEFLQSRINSYGKIFMTNLLGKPVIISADQDLNSFILKNDMRLFEPGWPGSFLDVLGEHSISVVIGEAHKHMRSIVINFLSNERLRAVFLPHADQIAPMLLSSWQDNSVISARDVAVKFSFYIMVKEIFSLSPEEPENDKLMREYDTLVRGITSIPWNLPGTQYQRALKSRKEIFKVFAQIIKERSREKKKGDHDLLDWVMSNTDYSKEQVFDFILHTLFAGHDTTSRAISLMIYFLEGCPQAIQQLREEHLQVAKLKDQKGKISLTWDDYKTMEFTKCVINETLRLGNIASLVQKKARMDVHYGDYVIPQGGCVMTSFTAVHLDPSLFENPETFDPWRWMGSFGASKRHQYFMAFGGGPRLCPGAELARLEMSVFIHHLILSYNWELVEPDHPMHAPAVHFFKGLPIKVRSTNSLNH
ncbi:putative cytochrome P450 [Dioscorea sansibarensis]